MSAAKRRIALACLAAVLPAVSSVAQTTAPSTALPPLSGPPIDVPMHVPRPPRDVDAPPAQAAPAPAESHAAPARPVPGHPVPDRLVEARGRGGTITPVAPQCRETNYRVIIDGRVETAIARLCRMADGQWRLRP